MSTATIRKAFLPGCFTVCLLLACGGLRAANASVFEVSHPDGAATIELDGRVVARQRDPGSFRGVKVIKERDGGFTVLAEDLRKEFARSPGKAEFTFRYYLRWPDKGVATVLFPMSKDTKATLVHGRLDRPPQTATIAGESLARAEKTYALPRYVTITEKGRTVSIDTYPSGAWGESAAAHDAPHRTMSCRLRPEGIEIVLAPVPTYAKWDAALYGKMVFYADGRPFEAVHVFNVSNYRYGFVRVVKLDFTNAPQPKKSYERRSVRADVYNDKTGYGWLKGAEDIRITTTSLDAKIHGAYAASKKPATFRMDVPPGHYYLTLNIGSADGPTGPMRVRVNGEERIPRLALKRGRYRAEILWVVSRRDYMKVSFEGLDNAPWQINALTLSTLGSLNEDYTLTRSRWYFKH